MGTFFWQQNYTSEYAMNRVDSGQIGRDIEHRAARYLTKQGLRVVEKNFHSRWGEIDLILRDKKIMVFTEVRFRRSSNFGSGAQTVTPKKQLRIIKTAMAYLQKHGLVDKVHCRFDVVSVSTYNGELEFQWIKDAFCA